MDLIPLAADFCRVTFISLADSAPFMRRRLFHKLPVVQVDADLHTSECHVYMGWLIDSFPRVDPELELSFACNRGHFCTIVSKRIQTVKDDLRHLYPLKNCTLRHSRGGSS
jgi:hypothetical protein